MAECMGGAASLAGVQRYGGQAWPRPSSRGPLWLLMPPRGTLLSRLGCHPGFVPGAEEASRRAALLQSRDRTSGRSFAKVGGRILPRVAALESHSSARGRPTARSSQHARVPEQLGAVSSCVHCARRRPWPPHAPRRAPAERRDLQTARPRAARRAEPHGPSAVGASSDSQAAATGWTILIFSFVIRVSTITG